MTLTSTIGGFFFRYRDLLPIPLALGVVAQARPRPLGWMVGLPFVLLGETLRVWSLCHIGPTTRTREICADRLVCSGPYAHVRNPLYLANMLKVLGILLAAGLPGSAFLVVAFYLLEFATIIPYEENFLRKQFGESFEQYCRQVPAMLPGFSSSSRAFAEQTDPPPFSWGEAFYSERRTFLSTGLLLGLVALSGAWRCRGGGR
jgi:protein-S-isoprenylcysteine O-methyltransferase Ste14